MAEAAIKERDKRRVRVGSYSIDGLSAAWENVSKLRDRMWEQRCLLVQWDSKLEVEIPALNGHVSKSIHNLRSNRQILFPLIHLMRQNDLLLPNIDRLIAEVQVLYKRNGLGTSKDHGDILYHTSWSIRHLLSLLKAELARVRAEVHKGVYKAKDRYSKRVDPSLLFGMVYLGIST